MPKEQLLGKSYKQRSNVFALKKKKIFIFGSDY